ncbi:hypothetical protein LOTGIDRAFT_127565 [Lottia gigantea]|uniref:Olfactomedin-like domain-containing protein n=1 Tax=Lottia gigantea TaxID=225164 RepID=V3ZY78_LOTGI|nr:hypothetical protein LOTGIDRAFT_127565 [Lottia gigantea]ESO87600.1 hypothetical protein LOTGIDRAFT_127565 [Lottia gigantea]
MIGKPLYERNVGPGYGCWMKDSSAFTQSQKEKIWVTFGNSGDKMYEYRTMTRFRDDTPTKVYNLGNIPFFGTGHVVYQNCFYYQAQDWDKIVRFDLIVGSAVTLVDLPGASYKNERFLYKGVNNYVDFSVDENGLWIIYSKQEGSNKLQLARLNAMTLNIMKTWEIDVERGSYGNGFMVCGVIYFIRSVVETPSVIDYAYDIYTESLLTPFQALDISNPYTLNVMVSYNPRDNKIYGWDRGKQITYPLLLGG